MRPVYKGESPYKLIEAYQDALLYLEDRIGLYCSYCKMPIIHVPEVEHIISRKYGIPRINENKLRTLDPTGKYYEKAKNTYDMVGLGNEPDFSRGDKDRRFLNRNTAYHKAVRSLENWRHVQDAPEQIKNDMKKQIIMTATSEGFFSVWSEVFSDEPQILLELIENFSGTNRLYYDSNGKVKPIL